MLINRIKRLYKNSKFRKLQKIWYFCFKYIILIPQKITDSMSDTIMQTEREYVYLKTMKIFAENGIL